MTLMRSNTTRRSAPRTRSRLRRPTSKSTTTTVWPVCASAAPRAAVDVVLPTPPLPDVTTKTCAICLDLASVERSYEHYVALQPGLDRLPAQARFHVVGGPIEAVDREQLRFGLFGEDAGAGISGGSGERAPAQRAVNVDRAA